MKEIKVVLSSCKNFYVLSLENDYLKRGDKIEAVGELSGKRVYIYNGYNVEEGKHILIDVKNNSITLVETNWFNNLTRKAYKI